MDTKILKLLKWTTIQEIVEMADKVYDEHKGYNFKTEASYYKEVLERLKVLK